jgi:hypothetical protein
VFLPAAAAAPTAVRRCTTRGLALQRRRPLDYGPDDRLGRRFRR